MTTQSVILNLIQNLRNEFNQEILGGDPKIVDPDPEVNSG
jgi:hypothetical protein